MFKPKDVCGCRETDPSHATAMRRLLEVTLDVLASAEPGTAQGWSWQRGLPGVIFSDVGMWGLPWAMKTQPPRVLPHSCHPWLQSMLGPKF